MLPALRPWTPLLTLLLACAPGKEDSGGDASDSDTTTTTIGHSSAPTHPDSDPTLPTTSAGSVSMTGPTTPTNATTEVPPDPSGGSITTTSTTSFPTTAPDDSATDTPVDPSGVPISPQETTVAFIVLPPDLPPGECDPWHENCPEGEKCTPFATDGSPTWNAVKCVPIADDPQPPGAACEVTDAPTSGLDNCQQHSMCWDADPALHGTCVAMCKGDGLDHFCADLDNLCMVANGGVILVCVPRCDPLLADCPEGQVCVPSGADFACAPDASGDGGQLFAPCEAGNTCDPGLVCASTKHSSQCQGDADECCLPFCDVDEPGGCPPGHACSKWFPDGGVLPELLDVGLCATP